MAVGAAGGPRIITQVLWALLRTIDDGSSAAEALTAPRLHHQWAPDKLFVEQGYDAARIAGLRALGHEIEVTTTAGVSQAVARDSDGARLIGVHDPRVPGAARGWDADAR